MESKDSIFYYVKIIDLKQKIQYNGIRIAKMKKLCTIWFKIKGRLKMTIKEGEMILNFNIFFYQKMESLNSIFFLSADI